MVTGWLQVWTQQQRVLEIVEVGRNQSRCMMTWMRSLRNQVWCCQTSVLLPTTRPFGSAQFVWLLKLVPPHDRLEITLNPVHLLSRRLLRAIHLEKFVQVALLKFHNFMNMRAHVIHLPVLELNGRVLCVTIKYRVNVSTSVVLGAVASSHVLRVCVAWCRSTGKSKSRGRR